MAFSYNFDPGQVANILHSLLREMGNAVSPVKITALTASVWTVGVNQSAPRGLTQTCKHMTMNSLF